MTQNMARNPLFDAQWRARLASAEAALQAARAEETSCAATGFGSHAHRHALARLDAARAARHDAWRMQFETVAT
ncbi:MAG TPA: hypothetical protein VEQ16_00995, partial [Acidocella sp.]|nr:hypothetical protein [Acidocella sp.]